MVSPHVIVQRSRVLTARSREDVLTPLVGSRQLVDVGSVICVLLRSCGQAATCARCVIPVPTATRFAAVISARVVPDLRIDMGLHSIFSSVSAHADGLRRDAL